MNPKKMMIHEVAKLTAAPMSIKSFLLFFQPEPKKREIRSGMIF